MKTDYYLDENSYKDCWQTYSTAITWTDKTSSYQSSWSKINSAFSGDATGLTFKDMTEGFTDLSKSRSIDYYLVGTCAAPLISPIISNKAIPAGIDFSKDYDDTYTIEGPCLSSTLTTWSSA